ncbi:MAG: hypothetical protein JSS20_13370, partial [Proteobacteria bacterium]|nr:hypothetical protein [Pseudomonadota bacterium]
MIAHVAEAGEGKGRVVLRLTPAPPNRFAIEAAIRVAQAFQSEVESLFVEDAKLLDVAALPFVHEISLTGRHRKPISRDDIERQMRAAAQAMARTVTEIAAGAEVPLYMTVVRDEPVQALAAACAARGPWNVIALSEPLGTAAKDTLAEIFASVPGTTGLVVVGPMVRRSSGRIVAVIEDIADFDAILRTARRIHATTKDAKLTLMLLAESEEEAVGMEEQARLAVGADEEIEILHARIEPHAPAVAAELIRRL